MNRRPTTRTLEAAVAAIMAVALMGTTSDAAQSEPEWDSRTGRLDPALFAEPPSTTRPHAFWFWNGKLTEDELERQLDEMQSNGVEEFFIHPRQGLGGEFGKTENDYYLSTDYFDKVGFVLEEARSRGMKAWLYDDLNWPSGFAGGRTVRGGLVDGREIEPDPSYVPWYLVPVAQDVTGPSTYDEEVPAQGDGADEPQPELVATLAARKSGDGSCVTGGEARGVSLDGDSTIELTDRIEDGRLRWSVPEGSWCVVHLVQRPLLNYHPDLEPDEPYVDMLNPDVTQKFIDITHESYYGRFADDFGSTIQGIFNDEPGFYNNFPDGRGGADSRGSVPWTPGFRDYLEQNAGYDLTQRLLGIWYDAGDSTTRTRVDYYDALSDRYNEAHTKPLADWAADHDIALISNPLVEEDLGSHKLIEGGSWFEMSRHYQLPGMDLISGLNTSAITPKLNSSVAHLFDRKRNLAETFGAFGWDLSMEEMKRTVAWEVSGGVDLIDNHAFYYSIDGQRAFESPPSQFFQNLMWPRFRQYADLVGRLTGPARGAVPMNPVGVLYPSSSVMAAGTPWNVRGFAGNGPELGPIDDSWRGTSNDLLKAQLDFDYLDELALAGDEDLGVDIAVEDGDLTLHKQRWQA
ncbi:MAG TPA: glycosyl hydrolase, partial [Nocardioidaceae bacterium]|nr:glycosyl hydrolase [Nocardioidaceae bacterium]